MQTEQLINWRYLSRIITPTKSETAIRSTVWPKKYEKALFALYEALEQWEDEYIYNRPKQQKYTIEEITAKINSNDKA